MEVANIDIFDPLCHDKSDVEKSLKRNCANTDIKYTHPYSDHEQCTFYPPSKRIKWETAKKPANIYDILDNSDRASVSDRVEQRINLHKCNLGLENKNITVQSIPDGQDFLDCSINKKIPFIFAVSLQRYGDYFDTLVHDMTENCKGKTAFNDIPASYAYLHTDHFRHSNDVKKNDCLLHGIYLKKMDVSSKGIVTVHAYQNKSFKEIQHCDPCIAIVDCVNENDAVIYIHHFSLSEDIVKDNSICHLAEFNYCPRTERVKWYFPEPVFDNSKFNVGSPFKDYYDKKIPIFKQNVDYCRRNEILMRNKVSKEEEEEEEEEEKSTSKMLLMIQKPILENVVVQKFLLKNENGNALTFHTRISELDDNDDEEKCEIQRGIELKACQFSLPIAGGAIVSKKRTVTLGRPIPKKKTVLKMKNFLENSKNRPIVILTDQSLCANVPDVNSKMDAIYVIVALKEERDKAINDRLNSVDASLAIAMQGSLSTFFVYLPSTDKFYYFRGVCDDNKRFGDVVTIDDILKLRQDVIQPRCLVTVPFPEEWTVYGKSGQSLFHVTQRDEPETLIEKIINVKEDEWSYIFPQLEINLKPIIFSDMITIIVKKLESKEKISRRACLKILSESKILKFPKREVLPFINSDANCSGNYSKKWLIEFIANLLNYDDRLKFISDYGKSLVEMFKVMDDRVKTIRDLYDILITCVPMRSAYGIRKQGIQQVKRKNLILKNCHYINNDMTIDDLDDLFSKECSQEGVIILQVEPDHFCESINDSAAIKKLTYRRTNFDAVNSEIASSFLKLVKFDFIYENHNMIIIPVVNDLIDAMKHPNTFNWTDTTEGGSIDLTRIILRKTVYNLIKKEKRQEKEINSPGHPIIGKIIINTLFSAIYNLVGDRTDFSNADESDGIIRKLRCLTGLILSIMASGSNTRLSHVYEVILRKNLIVMPKIKFNGIEGVWVKNLIEIWPYLSYKNSDLNIIDNVSNWIHGKLQDYIQCIQPKNEEKGIKFRKKAMMDYEFVKPLVLMILKNHVETNIDKKTIEQYLNSYEQKTIQKSKRKLIDKNVRYYIPTGKKVEQVLKLYSKLDKKYDSHFATCLERLRNSCNENLLIFNNNVVKNDDVLRKWDQVYSIALEKYLKKSQLIVDQVSILFQYISQESFSLNGANDLRDQILYNIFKFKTKLYDYIPLPDILILLNKCQTIIDYKRIHSKLNIFIEEQSKHGDFMEPFCNENFKTRDKINIAVVHIKKDNNMYAMAKWIDEQQQKNQEFDVYRFVKNYSMLKIKEI